MEENSSVIRTKEDLKYYIKRDMYARFGDKKITLAIRCKVKDMVKFNILLRKAEYHINNNHIICAILYKILLLKKGMKLGWSIDPNTFGPGLCVVHYGTVVVNGKARIGENARIHAGVNIGTNAGCNMAPRIGDNVYFGPGAKVFGDIDIVSNIAIGANAVVNKSFFEEGVTLGGIPARIISNKGTEKIIRRYME